MGRWAFLLAAAVLGGCGWISFRKPPSVDELRLSQEIRSFYAELQLQAGARFRIRSLEIDDLGPGRAVVILEGGFSGTERHTLVRRSGRWSIAGSEVLSP